MVNTTYAIKIQTLRAKDFRNGRYPGSLKACFGPESAPGFLTCTDPVSGSWLPDGPYVGHLSYWYLDNKLVGFYLFSPSGYYSQFVALLIARYGQPTWHGDRPFDGTHGRYY